MIDNLELLDPKFAVEVLSKTERPNLLCYLAMHQDYSEKDVWQEKEKLANLSESELGARIVRNCINYQHWGILEHPSITLNVINFPHSVMVQARTHRVGVTFDCIAGESMITIKQHNKIKIESVAKLYQMQQEGKSLPLVRTLNENRGYFEYFPIEEVFRNSPKNLYIVTLEDGKQLKCSLDHRIFTDKGWFRLKDLKVGDKVACNGLNIKSHNYGVKKEIRKARSHYTNPVWLAEQLQTKTPKEISQELECSYEVIKKYAYKFGLSWEIKKDNNKGKKLNLDHFTEHQKQKRKETSLKNIKKAHEKAKNQGHPSRKHEYLSPERVYNWQKYNRTKIINHYGGECNNCGSTNNLHCHHKNSLDDNIEQGYDLDNYEVLCGSCHAKEHKSLKAHYVKITSIEFLRNDITYDIEVNSKYHNFICDGVVIHNCQSQRYTGQRIIKLADKLAELEEQSVEEKQLFQLIEEVFYFRIIGNYLDRNGNKYFYSEIERNKDILFTKKAVEFYAEKVKNNGYAPEHARDTLTQNIRQHFVVTFNARSLLHFCDLRLPKDAQSEIRNLASLIFKHFQMWMPEVAEIYAKKRLGKNLLAP